MLAQPSERLTFFAPETIEGAAAHFFDTGISAGFPSPAEDFNEQRLSLDEELVKNKDTTFYARVSGQSMIGAGLDDGDLLVVDKSISPQHKQIAVCFLDGEFTVKRLKVTSEGVYLQPENPIYDPILVAESNNFQIWGIVTHVIKKM